MPMPRFIIFISVVLVIYSGIIFYIFKRAAGLFNLTGIARSLFKTGLILFSMTFFMARFLQSYLPLEVFEVLLLIGSYWLGVIIYLFLAIASIDGGRLCMRALKLRPDFIYSRLEPARKILGLSVAFMVSAVLVYGYYNARNVQVTRREITLPKKSGPEKDFRIAVMSDIHLGEIINNGDLRKFVSMINTLNPDLILIAGDIIDNRIDSLKIRNTGEIFLGLKSRLGIYAITGNHEYFQDTHEAVRYLEGFGIRFLLDSHAVIDNSFYLLGRKDRSIGRFRTEKRKSLGELKATLDRDLPVVLMDHQPYDLHEAENNSMDLQISGHTHNGQFFPGNIVVGLMYEKKYGYFKRGATQYYISSGIGTWGPAIRVLSRPEIVLIHLRLR